MFPATPEAVKTLLREPAYLEIWLRLPANCILVGHGLYTRYTQPLSFFLILCGSRSGLRD